MFGMGMQELVVIGIVAILLFGKRLPDMARTWGKTYADFRRGLADIQSQMNMSDIYSSRPVSSSSYTSSTRPSTDDYDDYDEATAPRFEPPPSEPQQSSAGENA